MMAEPDVIRTPDQRVRVFVSSTLSELAAERQAVREAVTALRLVPVMFELGARPHPPRPVYRAYLAQSQVFVGIYWQSYGWVAPGEQISGLEDEYQLSAGLPRLIYVKTPAPDREPQLAQLLDRIRDQGGVSYQHFSDPAGLQELVENDLAVLLSERFELTRPGQAAAGDARLAGALPVPATPLLGPPVDRVALWKRREHASPQNTRVRPRPDTGTRFPQPARLQRRWPSSPPKTVPPEDSTDSVTTSVIRDSFPFPSALCSPGK
jgi:hypothetical protein